MWKNLGINKKIFLCITMLLIMIAVMAIVYILGLGVVTKESTRVQQAEDHVTIFLKREIDHLKWITALQRYVFDGKQKDLTIQEDPHKCAFGQWYYGAGRTQAETLFPSLRGPLNKIEAAHTALHGSAGKIRDLKKEGKQDQAEEVFERVSMVNMAGVQELLGEISAYLDKEKNQSHQSFEAQISGSYISTYGIVAVSIVVALLLGLLITRSITAPILRLAAFAGKVAEGDFTLLPETDRRDEIGGLSNNLRHMVNSIVTMIGKSEEKTKEAEESARKAGVAVREAEDAKKMAEQATRKGMYEAATRLEAIVGEARGASSTLADVIRGASEGIDTQRRFTSETATAMGQMTTAVIDVASNASSAADSADEARKNAEQGSRIVADTIAAIGEVSSKAGRVADTMNTLGQQVQGIGHVMNVITDIADQTNLLALNAAIEAARAGDAGRGFAVVADEVRKLAEKTMSATKEVSDVIKAIQASTAENIRMVGEAATAVSRSTDLAQAAGSSLTNILAISNTTAGKVQSIAAASEEQSASSEEINKGTEEVNRIAISNAHLMDAADTSVKELDAVIRRIASLIEDLKRV